MRNKIFLGFFPWIFFAVFYGTTPCSMAFACLSALILTFVFEHEELKKGFILPWGTVIFFIMLGLNDYFGFSPWATQHASRIINSALAVIVYISMLMGKPFSMQYARQKVAKIYWRTPTFMRINWIITALWAVLMTMMALPSYILPPNVLADSWFWGYGFSIICMVAGTLFTKRIPNFYIGRRFWHQVAQLQPVDTPYLRNGFAPVKDEVVLDDLRIEGVLPANLTGMYLRNGPNPHFTPYTYTYPIDGDGMVHSVRLEDGKASYKNRFVRTKGLLAEMKAGKALYGGVRLPIVPDPKYIIDNPIKNTASIHIAPFGKYLLALYEAEPAYELDHDLNTLGTWSPTPGQKFDINAHHRQDPKTGEIYACSYDIKTAPYLTFYVFDKEAKLIKTIPIVKDYPTMVHDFVITEHYIIVFAAPAIFNFGAKPVLSYQPNKPMEILLINRNNFAVQKIITESFFVYHFVNAYEDNNKVLIDFVHHENLNLDPLVHKEGRGPKLYRAEINMYQLTYQHHCLCDITLEFPTYAHAYTSLKYRYGYFCAKSTPQIEKFDCILKYDFVRRQHQLFKFDYPAEVDEAIFVAEPSGKVEDQGYLMLYVYYPQMGTSDFVIIDAQRFNTIKPMALVKLGRRVPHGLHGSWLTK